MKRFGLFSALIISAFSLGIVMVVLIQKLSTPSASLPLFSQPDSTTTTILTPPAPRTVVYGYLPYWNTNKASFPSSVTHVSYFSLTIQQDGSLLNIPKEKQDPGYRKFQQGYLTTLQESLRPGQKIELTLSMMEQEEIPIFIHSPDAQKRLVQEVLFLQKNYPLSGINVDIEYNGSVTPTLQNDLVTLLSDIRTATKAIDPNFLLSMAVYGDSGSSHRLTVLELTAPHLDYIVVMTYDYHRRSSPRSGPVSPLYGKTEGKWEGDIMEDLQLIRQKVPAEKILLGIPFYGYEWSVEDATNPQSFTLPRSGATASYERVLQLLEAPGTKVFWDSSALSPYLQYEKNGITQRVYYDNPLSLSYKLDLVKKAGFGGIAIWALGYEGGSTDLWDVINSNL